MGDYYIPEKKEKIENEEPSFIIGKVDSYICMYIDD
jgi:hypothetical protein